MPTFIDSKTYYCLEAFLFEQQYHLIGKVTLKFEKVHRLSTIVSKKPIFGQKNQLLTCFDYIAEMGVTEFGHQTKYMDVQLLV